MVYTTIDQMISIMKEKNLPYFRVFDHAKEKLYDNDDVEAARTNNECENLLNFLSDLNGTYVFVKLSKVPFSEKNKGGNISGSAYQYRVNINSGNGSNREEKIGSTSGAFLSKKYEELLDKYNQLQLHSMLKDNDDKWEKRFAELESRQEQSPLEKYAPMLLPVFQKMAGIPIGDQQQYSTPINGTEPQAASPQPNNRDVNDRLRSALKRLFAIDKDFLQTIESLADFAEKNTDSYNQYMPMLKNMSK